MFIEDEVALREWLVATLEPLCDAEPIALARYVLALVAKDKPLDKLRENCIDRLEVFLDQATKNFVDKLFDVIRNGSYIPEAKKENVQPKETESNEEKSGDSSEALEQQNSASPDKEETEQQQNPTTSQTTTSFDYSTNAQQQSSGAIIQPIKRRYPYRSSSNRHHSPNPRRHVNASSGGANRYQASSHYRPTTSNNQRSHRSSSRSRSTSPPPAKRSQRSYSHSSTGSSSRSSPSRQINTIHPQLPATTTNTNFLFKKVPCSDFFDNKGYCSLGDACPYDHGSNALVFEQQQQQQQQQQQHQQQQQAYYPPYPPYGIPPPHMHPHYHEYNPEAPDLKHCPHPPPHMFMRHPMHRHPRMQGPPLPPGQPQPSQPPMMMMNPQRTLVTVVTNAEPLPLEQKSRQIDPMGMSNTTIPPLLHTKRHVTSGSYPNERRTHQHDLPSTSDSTAATNTINHNHNNNLNNNNNNMNNNNSNNSHPNNNNGYTGRGWKRPWQKPDGSGSTSATLEIRKIPVEFNTISKLNEHFSKFGTVKNVQIAYDGSPDSALVAYATFHEAETAYKNPQPLFNNRFIKIFWHNSNKTQNSGNNNNNNTNQPSQQQQQQQKPTAEGLSSNKSSTNTPNPMKAHWQKIQQLSGKKPEQTTTLINKSEETKPTPPTSSVPTITTNPPAAAVATPSIAPASKKDNTTITSKMTKTDAAKKTAIEIRRKKQGLLEEQIQQQKKLLKKLEAAETQAEKESIRSLMKQVDATIVMLKDSLRLAPSAKSSTPAQAPTTTKISQHDTLRKRAHTLKKEIESLRAKASADMYRAVSNTLGQTSLNFAAAPNTNDLSTKPAIDSALKSTEPTQEKILIKNIKDLPRIELDEFLKKSGATKIQVNETDESLTVTYPSKSLVDKIQKTGLKFKDRSLDISIDQNASLNISGKKRTLSETLEDELLGSISTDATHHDNDTNNEETDEPVAKRKSQNGTGDRKGNEEARESADEEERLLGDNDHLSDDPDGKQRRSLLLDNQDDSNQHYEFDANDLDDEIQLLDS